jgi:SAM-dependent methyltransferase
MHGRRWGENAAGPEHALALAANVAGYEAADDARYVAGAPHVKHHSLRRLHAQLIDGALSSLACEPRQARVLELGAGSGLACDRWFERGVRLTAVDSSRSMLARLAERASAASASVEIVVADAADFVSQREDRYDVVTVVSTLHHVPDYLDLVRSAIALLAPGGCLLTFQDPLRYDTVPRPSRLAAEAAFLAWRLGQGNLRRGVRTRWRWMRGVYLESELSDFEEYHVVRDGVDQWALREVLSPLFAEVRVVEYWSTQSTIFQWLGERAGLSSAFGAMGLRRYV